MTQEEKNKFIHDWITTYMDKMWCYESYAEKEDLANAMDAAIKWTHDEIIEDVCNYLRNNLILEEDYPYSTETLIDNLKKTIL